MTQRIEGKVARILSARELVINRGADYGVEIGMRFAILNANGADIKDPETGDVLGSVEIAKTYVKVTTVQPLLCVARTFRVFTTPGGPLFKALGAGLANPPQKRAETLRTNETSAQDELDESQSFVKTGDAAVQIVSDEFLGADVGN